MVWDLSGIKAGFSETTIVDVSRNGMRLLTDRKLTASSQVAIDFRGMVICGTVQYCTASDSRFTVGIRINGVLDQVSATAA